MRDLGRQYFNCDDFVFKMIEFSPHPKEVLGLVYDTKINRMNKRGGRRKGSAAWGWVQSCIIEG